MKPPIYYQKPPMNAHAIEEATEAVRLAFEKMDHAAYSLRAAIELQETAVLPVARERFEQACLELAARAELATRSV